MTTNVLSMANEKLSNVQSYLLGKTIIRPSNTGDHATISLGVTLWLGILLDYSNLLCETANSSDTPEEDVHSAMTWRGRLKRLATTDIPTKTIHLDLLLSALDDLSDATLAFLRDPDSFKGLWRVDLSSAVDRWMNESVRTLRGLFDSWKESNETVGIDGLELNWMSGLYRVIANQVDEMICSEQLNNDGAPEGVEVFAYLRQVACFLKKVEVDRPDLIEATEGDAIAFEAGNAQLDRCVESDSTEFLATVRDLRSIMLPELSLLDTTKILPRHGGGAVADTNTRSWLQKYQQFDKDARIAYLLQKSGLGTEDDYNPFARENSRSTRTSRFISVPKTWKKRRAISAEPAELQYWQQGVQAMMDDMFRRTPFWRMRIDLHDQSKSQKRALSGSIDGSYATIDLTSASDSVRLQLVRNLFNKTELGYWLLGTRSVYTEFKSSRCKVKLSKFAPMGSCTTFPVECMIFALVAELAVRRTRTNSTQRRGVQVYGDDIVVPDYAFEETVRILNILDFTVNWDKSFNTGCFRESCGTEAFRGVDIAPVRYTSVPLSWGSAPTVTSEESKTGFALANGLFMQGNRLARAYLLQRMFAARVVVKYNTNPSNPLPQQEVWVPCRYLFACTFLGTHGTVASTSPTNFHLRRKYDRGIQSVVYQVVHWKLRYCTSTIEEEFLSAIDALRLVEWLLRHKPLSAAEAEAPIQGLECLTTTVPSWDACALGRDLARNLRNLAELVMHDSDTVLTDRLSSVAGNVVREWLKSYTSSYEAARDAALDPYARLPIGCTLIPRKHWVSAPFLAQDATMVLDNNGTMQGSR